MWPPPLFRELENLIHDVHKLYSYVTDINRTQCPPGRGAPTTVKNLGPKQTVIIFELCSRLSEQLQDEVKSRSSKVQDLVNLGHSSPESGLHMPV